MTSTKAQVVHLNNGTMITLRYEHWARGLPEKCDRCDKPVDIDVVSVLFTPTGYPNFTVYMHERCAFSYYGYRRELAQ